jgi:hypothetical protein
MKQDRISATYSTLEQILPHHLDALFQVPYPLTIEVYLVFDKRSTKEPQAKSYENYLSSVLHDKDCPWSSKKITPDITQVKVEKYFPTDKSYLKELLHNLIRPRSFQFSDACTIIPLDDNDEPVPNLTLVYTDGMHHKYLPKVHGVTVFPSPKEVYMGRSTIFAEVKYYSGKEKEIIKNLLTQLLDSKLNTGVNRLLSADCKGRLIAYEKLLPPGKEIRQHWKINRNGEFVDAEYDPKAFEQMIINDDAFSFYPSVKQKVEFQGRKLDVQTRLIAEVDRHTSTIERAGKVFDLLTKAAMRLGLTFTRYYSGSSSARIHAPIDVIDVLEGTPYLLDKYSFIGAGLKKKRGDIEIDYKAVLGAVKDSIFLGTWNYLHKEHPPKIIKNKFNCDDDFSLVDFPTTDSIGTGSPKKIVRLNERDRILLKEVNQDNPDWEHWSDLPFMINLCTPLLENEPAPKSNNEILALCNALSASERCEKDYLTLLKQMETKITTDTIETVLKRTIEGQFVNLHVLSEEKFRERYG